MESVSLIKTLSPSTVYLFILNLMAINLSSVKRRQCMNGVLMCGTWIYVCLSLCLCVMISLKLPGDLVLLWLVHVSHIQRSYQHCVLPQQFGNTLIFIYYLLSLFSYIFLSSIICFGYPLTFCSSLHLFPGAWSTRTVDYGCLNFNYLIAQYGQNPQRR